MEFVLFSVGIVWIIGSCQFIKESIDETLHGLKGDKLYKNLLKEIPEKYGNELTKIEKFWRIFFSVILGIIYILGGCFCVYVAIYNLHTWLPK